MENQTVENGTIALFLLAWLAIFLINGENNDGIVNLTRSSRRHLGYLYGLVRCVA